MIPIFRQGRCVIQDKPINDGSVYNIFSSRNSTTPTHLTRNIRHEFRRLWTFRPGNETQDGWYARREVQRRTSSFHTLLTCLHIADHHAS